MTEKDMQITMEQYYKYIGIPSAKKQHRILNLLSYCKEIRDTAYPMKGSLVTELQIVEFTARKEKDLIYINGSLSLVDGERSENRCFESYIIEDKEESKTRIYTDITRLCVDDEPKMIRTSEEIYENDEKITTITTYSSGEAVEEKIFSAEIPRPAREDYIYYEKAKQLCAL